MYTVSYKIVPNLFFMLVLCWPLFFFFCQHCLRWVFLTKNDPYYYYFFFLWPQHESVWLVYSAAMSQSCFCTVSSNTPLLLKSVNVSVMSWSLLSKCLCSAILKTRHLVANVFLFLGRHLVIRDNSNRTG